MINFGWLLIGYNLVNLGEFFINIDLKCLLREKKSFSFFF